MLFVFHVIPADASIRIVLLIPADSNAEPGTWSSVFEAVRERCPHLTFLFAEWFAYHPAPVGYHAKSSTELVQREREDYRQLEKLVAIVRSRPGGYAYAGTSSVESRLYREF
jgi:hypothetical protein